jgi:hypothetical protein
MTHSPKLHDCILRSQLKLPLRLLPNPSVPWGPFKQLIHGTNLRKVYLAIARQPPEIPSKLQLPVQVILRTTASGSLWARPQRGSARSPRRPAYGIEGKDQFAGFDAADCLMEVSRVLLRWLDVGTG